MRNANRLILLLQILTISPIYSQKYSLNEACLLKDARSIALGGGIHANEQTELKTISINYFIPYQLKGLSTRSIRILHPTKWFSLDGSWAQTGDAIFQENYIALGFLKNVSQTFSIGVKAGYYYYQSTKGNHGSTLLSEINCNYQVYEKLQVGAYIFNPTGAKIENVRLSQSLHIGSSYSLTEKTDIVSEIEKQGQEEIIWHAGLEYAICETFFVRTGFSALPLKPSWGIGGILKRFTYALGGNIHPALGFSTCFSIHYRW